MQWSEKLLGLFEDITPSQRKAVVRIAEGELLGVPLTRLLSTTYSCQHCGRPIGRSNHHKDDRKRALAYHQDFDCEFGPKIEKTERDGDQGSEFIYVATQEPYRWEFAAASTTFYTKWRSNEKFWQALEQAKGEARDKAISEAQHLIKVSTVEAVLELRRQVREGERDIDKRAAAVSLLDRADVGTAPIVNDGVSQWLGELRGKQEGGQGLEDFEDEK